MKGGAAGGSMEWGVDTPTPPFGRKYSSVATTKWEKFVRRDFSVPFGMEANVIGPFYNKRKDEFAHLMRWAVHSRLHGEHCRAS